MCAHKNVRLFPRSRAAVGFAGIAATAALGMSLLAPVAAAGGVDKNYPQAETCPDYVFLAARGSDQNKEYGEYFGPQRYSEQGAESNGYEGPNLAGLFHLVEQRHPGAMDNAYVLALDADAYPASMNLPPLAQEGENLRPLQLMRRLGGVLLEHPLHELVYQVTVGFVQSLRSGMNNVPRVVERYEEETGCSPRYIAAGYSQGAIIATSAERYFSSQGKLAGAIYLGNPLRRPGGMAGPVPRYLIPQSDALPADRRIDYCLAGDFVCDLSLRNAKDALVTKAAHHASYFRDSQGDVAVEQDNARVADTVAGWLKSPAG